MSAHGLIPLEKDKDLRGGKVPWTSSKPFLENSMGVLIHRPRSVSTIKLGNRPPHLSVQALCGNTMNGAKKFTFLSAPGDGQIVCARCEDRAIELGLPSSSSLAGRHVHIGGVKAFKRCCKEEVAA